MFGLPPSGLPTAYPGGLLTYFSHLVDEDVDVQKQGPPGAAALIRPVNVGSQWTGSDVIEVARSKHDKHRIRRSQPATTIVSLELSILSTRQHPVVNI